MIENSFESFYKNKKVLITGHTGFKGSWLSIWLTLLGADVYGYSLNPQTEPALFNLAGLNDKTNSYIGDIRIFENFKKVIKDVQPDIVFHLAAQPLVRESYQDPQTTFQTNINGLINLLEIIRELNSIKTVLVITSDKCYYNNEWVWGYREDDKLGGFDPYSSSKACAEIIIDSYRKSFFQQQNIPIATARAGNVIGGGDWSMDRIIPDCVKAIVENKDIIVRNPNSIRPWQHVLEPLSGYLWLMKNLYNDGSEYAEAWNFGPNKVEEIRVIDIVKYFTSTWKGRFKITDIKDNKHEAFYLSLDCRKALYRLKWQSVLDTSETLKLTLDWYKNFYQDEKNAYELCMQQIEQYVAAAKKQKVKWTES